MTFHVGQKLECLNADHSTCLRRGDIYVCLATEPSCEFVGVNCCALHVNELPWAQWFKSRFRPVVERKTDISIFTEMLTPKREPVLLP